MLFINLIDNTPGVFCCKYLERRELSHLVDIRRIFSKSSTGAEPSVLVANFGLRREICDPKD